MIDWFIDVESCFYFFAMWNFSVESAQWSRLSAVSSTIMFASGFTRAFIAHFTISLLTILIKHCFRLPLRWWVFRSARRSFCIEIDVQTIIELGITAIENLIFHTIIKCYDRSVRVWAHFASMKSKSDEILMKGRAREVAAPQSLLVSLKLFRVLRRNSLFRSDIKFYCVKLRPFLLTFQLSKRNFFQLQKHFGWNRRKQKVAVSVVDWLNVQSFVQWTRKVFFQRVEKVLTDKTREKSVRERSSQELARIHSGWEEDVIEIGVASTIGSINCDSLLFFGDFLEKCCIMTDDSLVRIRRIDLPVFHWQNSWSVDCCSHLRKPQIRPLIKKF